MATDLGIALPTSWRRASALDDGVIVAARAASTPASGFRPEVVLRGDPATPSDLESRLHDFAIEDEDEFDLLGSRVAYVRFAHRVGLTDVLCEQWTWLDARPRVTLTCSVARQDYWDYCDVFEAIAETVDVGDEAA